MEINHFKVELTPEQIRDLPTTPVGLVSAKEAMTLNCDETSLYVTYDENELDADEVM